MFFFGPDQTLVRRQLEASCRALAAVAGQREPQHVEKLNPWSWYQGNLASLNDHRTLR